MTSKAARGGAAHAGTTTRLELGGGAIAFVESSAAVPLVSIVVALRSGAIADPDGKEGLLRFTSRMLRRGAGGLTSSEIESAIDRLGAEVGVDVGPSSASLHGQVIRRNLGPFCELLAKILGSPDFADDEIARLRRESVAELVDMRDNDRALAHVAFRRALFGEHPYARSSAGRQASVERISKDDVVATYRRQYVRSDLVIGFAGAITEAEAKTYGEALASALPEGPRVEMTVPEPAPRPGRHLAFVDKPERTQTQILIGSLGTSAHDPDHFPLVCATAVLGGTFTSRLMREIRSKRGWSYGTSARLSIERRRHAFAMSAAPAAGDCAPCVSLELEMLADFVRDGITARELGFIKNYLVRSHAFEVDTAPKRLGQALEAELLHLPADYHSRYVPNVRDVTLDAANGAVRQRLTASDLVVVVVGTASATLDAVRAAVPELATVDVVPFDRE